MTNRHLEWDACRNVRDLGGLPTADGARIRPGALVRADSLQRLTATRNIGGRFCPASSSGAL